MRTLGEAATGGLNDLASPGVQSGVMNDPAVSVHAINDGAIVERAAVFEDFFRQQSPNLYALDSCLVVVSKMLGRFTVGTSANGSPVARTHPASPNV